MFSSNLINNCENWGRSSCTVGYVPPVIQSFRTKVWEIGNSQSIFCLWYFFLWITNIYCCWYQYHINDSSQNCSQIFQSQYFLNNFLARVKRLSGRKLSCTLKLWHLDTFLPQYKKKCLFTKITVLKAYKIIVLKSLLSAPYINVHFDHIFSYTFLQ